MNFPRLSRETLRQFVKVVISGGLSTLVYFAFLNLLRFGVGWSSFWSVTGAFIVATGLNYLLNRKWSFQLTDQARVAETGAFYIVSIGAWAMTVLIVQTSEHFFGPLGPLGLNVTSIFADGVIFVPKFIAFKHLVFRRSLRLQAAERASAQVPEEAT